MKRVSDISATTEAHKCISSSSLLLQVNNKQKSFILFYFKVIKVQIKARAFVWGTCARECYCSDRWKSVSLTFNEHEK